MKLEILISCMHQNDTCIVQRTHVKSDVLIINQCDEDSFSEINMPDGSTIRMICTQERGLSRSRNMAIKNAKGDICLICDDDEVLEDNYETIIMEAFQQYPDADIITFALKFPQKIFPQKMKKINYIGAMKTSSHQIVFKKRSILEKNIRFDITMGSGTGNGGGEENKFLFDCLKNGLKIIYIPKVIATVYQNDSKWFHGYTNNFFINRGYSNRKLLGLIGAWLYAIEYSIVKYNMYKKENTLWNAIYYQLKGTFKHQ